MNPDDFEQRLQRQPLRTPPPEWRAEILAAAGAPSIARQEGTSRAALPSDARRSAAPWWLAWLVPGRAGWATLGAAWVLIALLRLAGPEESGHAPATAVAVSPEAWLAQRRLMAELMETPAPPREPVDATRPRSSRDSLFQSA